MAAIHGKQGTASFSGVTFEMSSFTIDATADVAEASVMSSAAVTSVTHWKEYVAGFKGWTVTAEVLEPAGGSGAGALGTKAQLVIDTTAGWNYSGSAICTGLSPSVDSTDAARATVSFQGTGRLTAVA